MQKRIRRLACQSGCAFFKEKGKYYLHFCFKKEKNTTYRFFHTQDLQRKRVVGLVIESLAIHLSSVRLLLTSILIFKKRSPCFFCKLYFDAKAHTEISMPKWMCCAQGRRRSRVRVWILQFFYFQFKKSRLHYISLATHKIMKC